MKFKESMKRFTIILALTLVALVSTAQTNQPTDSVVTIHLKQSQLSQLQQILNYAYQNRMKTQWPAVDTETLRVGIEQIFPVLQPAAEPKVVAKAVDSKKKPTNGKN